MSCSTVLSELPELGTLSGKAAATPVGIAPFPDDRGGRCGRRVIRGGHDPVRSKLYMCALSAIRCSSTFINGCWRAASAKKSCRWL